MKEVSRGPGSSNGGNGKLTAKSASMPDLAAQLSSGLGMPVSDENKKRSKD
jgi:hypothetical protein